MKVRGELTKRANLYIVRTFPKISANPAGPDFGKYCKYQLIKFKPWEGQPLNAWNNEDESDQMFINAYEFFLMTDEFAEENLYSYSDETDRVHDAQCGQTFENDPSDNQDDDDDESEVDPYDEEEVDDWMLLCRINRGYGDAGNRLSESEAVDWFEMVRAVPRDLLRDLQDGSIVRERRPKNMVSNFEKIINNV
jgi:hypothetical protein